MVEAHNNLERVKALEFAAAISKAHNQGADWNLWTDPGKIEANFTNFKKPFEHLDEEKPSPILVLWTRSNAKKVSYRPSMCPQFPFEKSCFLQPINLVSLFNGELSVVDKEGR